MREVVFALLPRVVLLDLAGPADAFRNANKKVPGSYRLRFVAPTPSLPSSVGLELAGLEPLPPQLPDDAIVVVVGITGESIPLDEPAIAAVTQWLASGADTHQHSIFRDPGSQPLRHRCNRGLIERY